MLGIIVNCKECNKRLDPVVEMLLYGNIQVEAIKDKDGMLIEFEFTCGECRS